MHVISFWIYNVSVYKLKSASNFLSNHAAVQGRTYSIIAALVNHGNEYEAQRGLLPERIITGGAGVDK